MRTTIATLVVATGLAALPISSTRAQYYCDPNPLAWPFCIAGAAVGTAATITTAPFYGPYYYYYGPPYYYPYGYYYPAHRHKRRHHH